MKEDNTTICRRNLLMTKNEMKSKGTVSHFSERKHRRIIYAAVVMLICCLAFVWVAGAADFSGGSGTPDDPYQITTTEDFDNIKFKVGGNNNAYYYKLMNDLDFGYNAPDKFGTVKIFYGVFDGNGKTISNISFSTNTPGEISLFGRALSPAKISNLSVANVSVTVGGDVSSLKYGTITSEIQGKGINCHVKNITLTINPGETVKDNKIGTVGGIFGNSVNKGEVRECSINKLTVIINSNREGLYAHIVGGICAQVNEATVTNCSIDDFIVQSPAVNIEFVGGIFGRVTGGGKNPSSITGCSVGDIDASRIKDVYVLNIPDYMPSDYNPIYGVYYTQLDKNGNKITGTINIAGVTGWALTADTQWHNKNDDSFEISTAEELAGLAKLVNLGNTFSGKTVVLKEDIDLENKEWTPIGKSLEKSFQGTFEGGWHTVSNLKVTGANENVGLFGYAADAEIRNLTVTEADISGSRNVGGIAGNAGAGTSFINCTCSGEVTANDVKRIGGIAGVWNNTIPASPITLQNSTFTGNLSSKDSRIQSSLTDFPNAGLIGDYSTESGTGILEFIDIELKEPTPRIGYTFLGWKKSDTETVLSPVTLSITKDSPLTEVWKKNNHTITFKDGDTQITILEFEYESSVTAPANPTKDGYIFKGWSPELPETMPDEDITVSAVWEMIPEEPTDEDETNHVIIITPPKTAWQVVFYPNGGEGNMNAEVFVEGEEEALPKNSFYRDGYVFKGWSLTPEGEVFYIDEETVVIDKTTYLYAVWEKIPDTPQTPEKPNIPTIPIIIAGIIVGLLVMIFVITRKRQKEE